MQRSRIESREITECLNKDPEAEKSHVAVVEQNGWQLLGAYLQPPAPDCFHPEDVKERLRSGLPYHMIPNLWQVISRFQHTMNDRVDIYLPPPPTPVELEYVPPVHPGEIILCDILKEMPNLPRASIEAGLIDDLGMISSDILRLVTEADKRGCPVSVSAVYTTNTPRRLLMIPRQEAAYQYKQ